MKTGLPRPTGKSVRDLHERLVREWGPCLKLNGEFRELIFASNKIETLEESPDRNMTPLEIHSGRAGGIIEHANGLIMAMPSFHAEPPTQTTEDTREAESVERASARLFERELLANDFWPSVGRDILSYGRAFLKAMLSMSEWTAQAGYPVRGEKEGAKEYLERIRRWKSSEGKFPFIIQHVPALSILPMLDNKDNVLATIEEKFVSARILADDMGSEVVGELLKRHSLKWYDQLPVIEYIDSEWVGYFLAGTEPADRSAETPQQISARNYLPLRAWKHGLGKHPVVMIPGMQTGEREYVKRWKSFLTDGRDALELYDFLLSRLATMVWVYYLPSYVWRLAGQTTMFKGKDRPVQEINLGGVTTLYSDEELTVLPIPSGLPDALTLLSQADDIIQRHTLEDVLFGRVAGAAPAFQVNLRINVAKSKLTPIAQHLARGITNIMELFFRGVEQLGEAVPIGGETITTSMARKYRNRVTASIEPKSPIDRNQDIGAAKMALEFGLPWDWICEHILDIEDPATLRLLSDIREIEESDLMKQRLLRDALEQLELLVEEEDFVDSEEVDMARLPPEFREALDELLAGGFTGELTPDELAAAAGAGGPGAPIGGGEEGPLGLGRGPYPEGASPQAVGGGRGLLTPKRQPQPGTAQPGTKAAVPGAF